MEFGLFSESGTRGNALAAQSYAEDLHEIVTAEALGFREVWIAERASRSDRYIKDIVSASNLLIAAAATMTERIMLGTGIRPLPYHHPFTVATEAAVCDHLTGGRYMLGYGGTHGLHGDHHAQMGIDSESQRAMVYEAVDYIMQCFTCEEPFDYDGRFWHGRKIKILPRPLQKPHPPIAAACTGAAETLELAGRSGFIPLLGRGTDEPERIREMGDAYASAAQAAGRAPSRAASRVAHHVYVSDRPKQAREELRAGMVPWLEHRMSIRDLEGIMRWLGPAGAADAYFDDLMNRGIFFIGDPDAVCGAIQDYYTRSGGFGVLLLFAAQGYVSWEQWEHSMRLFAEQVAPRLAHLDPDRVGAESGKSMAYPPPQPSPARGEGVPTVPSPLAGEG